MKATHAVVGNGGPGAPAVAPIFRRGRRGSNNTTTVAANNNTANTGTAEGAAAPVVETDLEGDKGIRGFWGVGRECIFDIRISNTESRKHCNKDPVNASQARRRKRGASMRLLVMNSAKTLVLWFTQLMGWRAP